ncbi:hypothetical protein JAAARDRAFT_168173 [Jaapia argillacea MUCL 33604]|uniref:NGG1p interacting factor 3 n=1 Tax=Jaapia argillacea MUCL 33604 TaxID=933084 RepID=A0A067QH84_9AGAM|nr:hypothetical protein JAAARDRAFT_168173 [Jaapia argillacea MUCL 33604]
MSVVRCVTQAMERIAPLRLAEKWDNVGLLLESPLVRPEARKVLLTIDLTPRVLHEALSHPTPPSLILSYHPPIFNPLPSLTLSNPLQKTLLTCASNGISVYSPHTALDGVWGGICDWLAGGLFAHPEGWGGTVRGKDGKEFGVGMGRGQGEEEGWVEVIEDLKEDLGAPGRIVRFNHPVEFGEIIKRVKKHLGLLHVQVAYPQPHGDLQNETSSKVQSVAICAGSGGSMLLGVNADVYLTGEMSHHEVIAAQASNHHIILCGHTNTERGYLPILAQHLTTGLWGQDIEVVVSKADQHPLEIV